VATLAAYAAIMERDRKREGLRICRAAWLIGVSVREYREIEAGDRMPRLDLPADLRALRVAADVRGRVMTQGCEVASSVTRTRFAA
jgi:hypothetical protein